MMCFTDWETMVEEDDVRVSELWVLTDEDLWPAGKKLKVQFLNKIKAWRREDGQFISKDDIITIANEWHKCGTVVPEFLPCKSGETGDIRVQFIGRCLGRTA